MGRADTVLARSQAQTKTKFRLAGHDLNLTREKDDFYPTPPMATERLLEVEKFDGNIWECACGDGAISKVLEQHNYKVYSTDLIDRNYGQSDVDFLLENQQCDNIITNPPFKLSLPFVYKAIELTKRKVAFLCRITFLEGVARQKMFHETPLENVYIFSRRITFTNPNNGNKTHGGGMLAFAWFVWNKEYTEKPKLNWI
tara:strand:+ start:61 stop:657 length:597 start_codon:yes stop_codon:yes gene_type:complete